MTPLEHLAEHVNAAQDAELRALSIVPAARERLLAALGKSRQPGWRWAAFMLPLAAAAAYLIYFSSQPLVYRVGNAQTKATVGSWLAAPADHELPLYFSDQSQVTLGAGSHARVTELNQREVKMLLENGRVSVGVRHQKNRRWHLRAGPFDVTDTGTRFEVTWVPEREQFEVTTLEGSVEVAGEQFAPRRVSAGETLRAERRDAGYRFVETNVLPLEPAHAAPGAASVLPAATPTPAGAAATPSAVNDAATSAAASANVLVAKPEASTPPAPSWRALAAVGQYRAALDQAEKDGFERLCASVNLPDLLALSEAARFAGHAERARLALMSLRQRFHGDAAASVATFTLGRIAFDNSKDYSGAAHWFRTYLAEQPGGALAREAAGRLIEALQRGGDHAGAQVAARSYLARYPEGPQKPFAQRVLAQ